MRAYSALLYLVQNGAGRHAIVTTRGQDARLSCWDSLATRSLSMNSKIRRQQIICVIFTFRANPFYLKNCWTDFHHIFKWRRAISVAINAHIRKAMMHCFSEHENKKWRRSILTSAKIPPKLIGYHRNVPWTTANNLCQFYRQFCPKLVAMATSLE